MAALTVEDLAPIDELHAGSLSATAYLLARLDLRPQSRLLDVGCGIGGPTRAAAASISCHVTGVDLTPEFVATAASLTKRVGRSDRVDFKASSGQALPFGDSTFDRAMMIHVGMNIPDKEAVFVEVRRVLEPGGLFALFEQMAVADGALTYPMPWAHDQRSSFVESPEDYAAQLVAAGFAVEHTEDRTAQAGGPPPSGPSRQIGPQVIFGPGFIERVRNNVAATAAGLPAPVLIVARAA